MGGGLAIPDGTQGRYSSRPGANPVGSGSPSNSQSVDVVNVCLVVTHLLSHPGDGEGVAVHSGSRFDAMM